MTASAILLAVALLGAAPAPAQPAPAPAERQVLALPSGIIPKQIFGIDCKARDSDAYSDPTLMCEPADITRQPSISVVSAIWKRQMSRADLIAHMREAFHERPMFNVIREEPFAPPGDPQAVGFRALYQTELGNRYVWSVLSGGRYTRVMVHVFAPADFAAMQADIEAKVFGVAAPKAAAGR